MGMAHPCDRFDTWHVSGCGIGKPAPLTVASPQVDPGRGMGLGTPAAAALMPGGGAGCDGLPAVSRAYNLYQPYDPVAYRCAACTIRSGSSAS